MAHLLSGHCCNLLTCTVFHLYWKPIKCKLDIVFLPFHIRHAGETEKSDNSFMFVVVARGARRSLPYLEQNNYILPLLPHKPKQREEHVHLEQLTQSSN